MWKSIVLAVIGCVAFSSAVSAACSAYPYTLTNGTTADASQVMANFNCAALTSGATLSATTLSSSTLIGSTNLPGSGIINSSGFIGVGTATPAFQLSAYTPTASATYDSTNMQNYGQLQLANGANNLSSVTGVVIEQFNAGGAVLAGYTASGQGFLALGAADGTTGSGAARIYEYMRIANGGNVGIDTSSPSYTLHVNGSVAGTSAYVNLSDERLKKDVRPIGNALSLIEELRGVRFQWKTPDERTVGKTLNVPVGKNQVGFIAQDVEKVLPEAVSTAKGPEAIKSVAESKVVPVLVEALKELKAANDNEAAEIRELKIEVSALERKAGVRTAQR